MNSLGAGHLQKQSELKFIEMFIHPCERMFLVSNFPVCYYVEILFFAREFC